MSETAATTTRIGALKLSSGLRYLKGKEIK